MKRSPLLHAPITPARPLARGWGVSQGVAHAMAHIMSVSTLHRDQLPDFWPPMLQAAFPKAGIMVRGLQAIACTLTTRQLYFLVEPEAESGDGMRYRAISLAELNPNNGKFRLHGTCVARTSGAEMIECWPALGLLQVSSFRSMSARCTNVSRIDQGRTVTRPFSVYTPLDIPAKVAHNDGFERTVEPWHHPMQRYGASPFVKLESLLTQPRRGILLTPALSLIELMSVVPTLAAANYVFLGFDDKTGLWDPAKLELSPAGLSQCMVALPRTHAMSFQNMANSLY